MGKDVKETVSGGQRVRRQKENILIQRQQLKLDTAVLIVSLNSASYTGQLQHMCRY